MYTEFRFDGEGLAPSGLVERALRGEVFVIREALQHFDLFRLLVDASLAGIRKSVGEEAERRAKAEGFEHIHEWVEPAKIPAMTEAVYDAVRPLAPAFLRKFVHEAFPDAPTLYYEESPNVRFHIPFDLAAAHRKAFTEFAKDYGEGKIAAHGPHRDSWLDCPANGVNLWFAIGAVRKGNGLTVYDEDYESKFKYKRSGDIADGEKLHRPTTFDLKPGDCIMFHTDQMHGSELNRTNETRYVISFRMTFGKPRFPNRHFHKYVNAKWVESPLKPFASIPAMVQASYPRSLMRRIAEKLASAPPKDKPAAPPETLGVERDGKLYVPLAAAPVGSIRGVSASLCVARLSETEVITVTRRCPHSGGDFANGWVDNGSIVCPWHNLPFDPASGCSPCKALTPIRRFHCEIVGDQIVIDQSRPFSASALEAATV